MMNIQMSQIKKNSGQTLSGHLKFISLFLGYLVGVHKLVDVFDLIQ